MISVDSSRIAGSPLSYCQVQLYDFPRAHFVSSSLPFFSLVSVSPLSLALLFLVSLFTVAVVVGVLASSSRHLIQMTNLMMARKMIPMTSQCYRHWTERSGKSIERVVQIELCWERRNCGGSSMLGSAPDQPFCSFVVASDRLFWSPLA